MNTTWELIWRQFRAAIDMLDNAIVACPDDLWSDRSQNPEYWYVAFHTLFFLDYLLSDLAEGFAPSEPFTLDELDRRECFPSGLTPGTSCEAISSMAAGNAGP